MSWLLGEPISRASILSTVSGVGGAVFNADKETLFSTDKDFRRKLLILYAGRASEKIKFQDRKILQIMCEQRFPDCPVPGRVHGHLPVEPACQGFVQAGKKESTLYHLH